VDYGPVEYTQADTPLVPLYQEKTPDGQTVLSRKVYSGTQPDSSTSATEKTAVKPACFAYAYPVRDSMPLFLMRETATGKLAISTDPYLFCTKIPFANPYPAGHAKHDQYENRVRYITYDGKTEFLDLLGFVMPKDKVSPTLVDRYADLKTIAADPSFFSGKGETDANLVIRVRE
jgi:hypothetical protein